MYLSSMSYKVQEQTAGQPVTEADKTALEVEKLFVEGK